MPKTSLPQAEEAGQAPTPQPQPRRPRSSSGRVPALSFTSQNIDLFWILLTSFLTHGRSGSEDWATVEWTRCPRPFPTPLLHHHPGACSLLRALTAGAAAQGLLPRPPQEPTQRSCFQPVFSPNWSGWEAPKSQTHCVLVSSPQAGHVLP